MRRNLLAALIASAAALLVFICHKAGILERLELQTRDVRMHFGLGRKPAAEDIVIAWIDQDSMDFLRREKIAFPWPRSLYADVLGYLKEGGAKAVIFDVLFSEPGGADDDRMFGEALATALPNAFCFKFVNFRDGGFTEAETTRLLSRALASAPPKAAPASRGAVLPIPEIEEKATLLGFVNTRADNDRVHRHYDLIRSFRGKSYPSLALAAASLSGSEVSWDGEELMVGSRKIPTENGRMALNFRGPEFSFEHVKFVNILVSLNLVAEGKEPVYPARRFQGKTVIVGINAEGYEDTHPTPMSPLFPGPEVHATALDNLLTGDPLKVARWAPLLVAVSAILTTLAVFGLRSVLAATIASTLIALAIAGISAWMFANRVILPTAAPLLAVLFSSVLSFLYRLIVEGRQKRELRKSFASYMAPEIVEEVISSPEGLKLGGHEKRVTLFFSDLAGFTSLAEATGPTELVAFLNDYFTRLCDKIMAERGIIDKFIGDAIMAIFGTPHEDAGHPRSAVLAALAAMKEADAINGELAAAGRPTVKTRIGIHTGQAIVGNMGSARRFDYTAIGDTVNLASRLEGANKAFGTYCLVSASTWEELRGEIRGREVGRIRVVGRHEPMRVYEPLRDEGGESLSDANLALYREAVSNTENGRRELARSGFQDLGRRLPDDPVVKTYLRHLEHPDWDGIFSLDSK